MRLITYTKQEDEAIGEESIGDEEFQEEEDKSYIKDLESIKKELEKEQESVTKIASKLAKIIDDNELDLRDPDNTMIKNSLSIAASIIKTNVTDIDRVINS